MSVWKRIESKVLEANVKRDVLETALKDIGIGLDFNTKTIKNGFGEDKVDAALVNLKTNKVTSLGFVFNEKGGLELYGDIWGTGFGDDGKQEGLLNKIAQSYQKANILQVVEQNGWTVENIQNVDKKVKIELYQL